LCNGRAGEFERKSEGFLPPETAAFLQLSVNSPGGLF